MCDRDHPKKGFFFSQQSHFEKRIEIFPPLRRNGTQICGRGAVLPHSSWSEQAAKFHLQRPWHRQKDPRGYFGGLSFSFKELEEIQGLIYLLGLVREI